mmetsp:Transcript_473/g.755  ORF Transcript_473/g.755 Transcript_473/m.755 type:complete len:154 (-) Transcript_473:1104-1565(-)
MDDLDIGNYIMGALGLPPKESSATDEQVGEERLGSSNALASFGPTLLLGSLFFAFIIAVIMLIIICAKRVNLSEKSRTRVQKLKRKVFFNPIVRYLLLNALKLNMTSLVAIKASKGSSTADLAVPISMLAIVNLAPLIFSIVTGRNRDNLSAE